jgi:hypothetical protein
MFFDADGARLPVGVVAPVAQKESAYGT